ncbi:hypothetical protein RJ55_01179 [Drechmeria coniospora]|nr:hypothetical protein RJ55_01179 [Drechmeria coniospora]
MSAKWTLATRPVTGQLDLGRIEALLRVKGPAAEDDIRALREDPHTLCARVASNLVVNTIFQRARLSSSVFCRHQRFDQEQDKDKDKGLGGTEEATDGVRGRW